MPRNTLKTLRRLKAKASVTRLRILEERCRAAKVRVRVANVNVLKSDINLLQCATGMVETLVELLNQSFLDSDEHSLEEARKKVTFLEGLASLNESDTFATRLAEALVEQARDVVQCLMDTQGIFDDDYRLEAEPYVAFDTDF